MTTGTDPRRSPQRRRFMSSRSWVWAPVCALSLVMAGGCAKWKKFAYEGFNRDSSQQPERVIAALDLKPGDRVADLGAGGGYFTFRFADAVGPTGRVYAIDVDPDMIEYLKTRAAADGYQNVEVRAATADDAGLPPDSVDLLFTCNTDHHLDDRSAYFARTRSTLRPGGRVAIIDMNGTGWFSWLFGHATPADTVRAEMQAAGYQLAEQHDFLDGQSFLVFKVEG
jgi:ubiquinone/menaquinone biosynthesis C-methylase UbiE